tara:strand:- start:10114 stop:10275 length:162 start_codon:yes stop_codon:yes gene_type:complete
MFSAKELIKNISVFLKLEIIGQRKLFPLLETPPIKINLEVIVCMLGVILITTF